MDITYAVRPRDYKLRCFVCYWLCAILCNVSTKQVRGVSRFLDIFLAPWLEVSSNYINSPSNVLVLCVQASDYKAAHAVLSFCRPKSVKTIPARPNRVCSRMKIHSQPESGRKYRCEICGFETFYYCYYEEHLWTHSGESQVACDVYGKFTVRLYTKIHVRIGEKPEIREFCEELSVSRECLIKHRRTRTDERHCEYKIVEIIPFTRQAILRFHSRGHEEHFILIGRLNVIDSGWTEVAKSYVKKEQGTHIFDSNIRRSKYIDFDVANDVANGWWKLFYAACICIDYK